MAGRGRKGGKVGTARTAGKGKPPHRADRADRAGWTGRAGNDGAGKAGGAGRAAGTVVALSVVVRTFRSAVAGLLRDWRSAHLQVGRSPRGCNLKPPPPEAWSPEPRARSAPRAVGGAGVPVEPTSRGGTALPRRPVGGDAPSAGKPARRVERTPADRCPVCRLRRRAPTARRCRPRRLPVRRGALRLWRWTVVVRTFRSAFALPEEACGLRRA